MAAVAALPLAARFVVDTPLWLDEALSVNIAKLPLSQLGEALRHDGHPPLYYVLLHGWMDVFGEGNLAVRAMSGVISLIALPLAFLVGRRTGGYWLGVLTAWTLALSPFFLRYGSETRMYSLVIVLSLAGYLSVDTALRERRNVALVGVALSTCGLLWTHYWSWWLLATAGLLLLGDLVVRRRRGRPLMPTVAVIAAMGVGGLGFLPWLPSMLYQADHTGTPWAEPFRPATLFITAVTDFNGGPYSEPQILMLFTLILTVVALFAVGTDRVTLTVDLRTQADARLPAVLMFGTMALASVASLLMGAAFASRYAAVFFPFWVLLVALGLHRFVPGRARTVVLVVFGALSLLGSAFVFRQDRTQAGPAAEAIRHHPASDSIVVTCPDQLGPALSRALGDDFDVVTYPRFESPLRVDWVDYAERNAKNDPIAFADELLARAGSRAIYVAYRTDFLTIKSQCADMVGRLNQSRPSRVLLSPEPEDFFEAMTLVVLPGANGP